METPHEWPSATWVNFEILSCLEVAVSHKGWSIIRSKLVANISGHGPDEYW